MFYAIIIITATSAIETIISKIGRSTPNDLAGFVKFLFESKFYRQKDDKFNDRLQSVSKITHAIRPFARKTKTKKKKDKQTRKSEKTKKTHSTKGVQYQSKGTLALERHDTTYCDFVFPPILEHALEDK